MFIKLPVLFRHTRMFLGQTSCEQLIEIVKGCRVIKSHIGCLLVRYRNCISINEQTSKIREVFPSRQFTVVQ